MIWVESVEMRMTRRHMDRTFLQWRWLVTALLRISGWRYSSEFCSRWEGIDFDRCGRIQVWNWRSGLYVRRMLPGGTTSGLCGVDIIPCLIVLIESCNPSSRKRSLVRILLCLDCGWMALIVRGMRPSSCALWISCVGVNLKPVIVVRYWNRGGFVE